VAIWYSPAVTMAVASCFAQNPVPEPVSMQTPEKKVPVAVRNRVADPNHPQRPGKAGSEPLACVSAGQGLAQLGE